MDRETAEEIKRHVTEGLRELRTEMEQFGTGLRTEMEEFRTELAELRDEARRPVADFLAEVIRRTGLLDELAASPDRAWPSLHLLSVAPRAPAIGLRLPRRSSRPQPLRTRRSA